MLQAVRLLTELARPAAENHHRENRENRDHRDQQQQPQQQQQNVDGTMDPGQSTSSVSVASASASEGSVQFREIYKNGWLRRTDRTDKETNRFWVAFCVHDDAEPRLEGFADQKQATTHSPLWAHSLRGIQHLSPTLCATQRHDYEFCVNFSDDRVLRLAAPTYQAMLDWVQLITRKLTDMKILRPKENLYSKGPERIATRDPTSPLPPPPLSTGSTTSQQSSPVAVQIASTSPPGGAVAASALSSASAGPSSATSTSSSASSPGREAGTSADTTAPMVFTFDDISLEDRRAARPVQGQVQRAAPPPPPTPSPRIVAASAAATSTPTATTSDDATGDSSYESIFMASSYSPTGDSARAARDLGQSGSDASNERYVALMEYRSNTSASDAAARTQQLPRGAPEQPRAAGAATTTTSSSSSAAPSSNVRRQLTLREQQVYQLRREMAHPAGVRLLLGRRECKDSIAFVDTYGAVWVAGWKQREHPLLYNVLHVGDLVLSVAGIPPPGAGAIKDILKGCTTPRVEVIVRRLPYARAVTLTKRNDTEDFGLEVNGNEVSGVSGVALSLGLPPLATATDPTAPAGSNTTWTLTEINGKPLNIFDGGACERFRAVGRDISIVIQPTDLVSSLRKKLRTIRSYKNFVMQ